MRSNSKNYYGETIRNKLILSPIQKYIKYDRYPYKLVLSFLLVILTTLGNFNLLNIYCHSGQNQIQVWRDVLSLSKSANDENKFFTIQDYQYHLFSMLTNLQNLPDILFQKIDDSNVTYTIDVIPIYPVADSHLAKKKFNDSSNEHERFTHRSFFKDNYTYDIDLYEGIMRPFNMNSVYEIKNFLQKVHKFSFRIKNMKLYVKTPLKTVDFTTCWNVDVDYFYQEASYILAKSSSSFFPCQDVNEEENNEPHKRQNYKNNMRLNQLEYSEKFMGDSIITLHLAVFFAASISLILNLKYIYEMIQVYLETIIKSKRKRIMFESVIPSEYSNEHEIKLFKKKTSPKAFKNLEKLLETDKPWHLLTFREKMLFFDFWFILGIIGNMIQIWSSIFVFVSEIDTREFHGNFSIEILIGFSCFFAWLNMIRYLEYNKSIFTISNILKRSLPQMFLFIIGFIPIFLAYVFLGISLFWRYDKFKDPNEAAMSLFSLIMGDNIFYFLTTVRRYGVVALIYFFSFMIVFFMAIQNIFVSIICSKAREKEIKETENRISLESNGVVGDSKIDLIELTKTNNIIKSNIFKKQVTLDNFNQTAIVNNDTNSDWKLKTFKRMQSLAPPKETNTPTNEASNPLIISTAFKKTLERRATINMSVNPSLNQQGAFTNLAKSIPLKKYKSIKNLKNIEMTEFEKDRILNEVKYYTEEALTLLDDMYRDNVADLEFYKLKMMEMVGIKQEYLEQLSGLSIKIKKIQRALSTNY